MSAPAGSGGGGPASAELDDIDKTILRELQRDGRISYAQLAPIVRLSPAAARARVQRLIEMEAVQVVGVTNPLVLGYPVTALLGVQVSGDAHAVADGIATLPNVIYLVLTSGNFDLFVEVVCTDTAELFAVINDHIRPLPGVVRVESFLEFAIHTHRFGWGVR